MSRLSFRKNLRVLTSVALLLIALSIGAVGLTVWGLHSDAIREAYNDTNNVAAILGGQIERSLESANTVLSDVREITKTTISTASESATQTNAFYTLLHEQLLRIPKADVVAVIGRNGHVANSTTQWPPTGTDVIDRDYFQQHKNVLSEEIYISTLMNNRVSGEKTVFLSKRVSGPDGQFWGLVLVGIKLSYFESIYHSIKSLRDRSFVLLHPNGTLLVRYPDSSDRTATSIPSTSPWYRLASSGGGNYRSPGYFDHEVRYVSVHPLEGFPLVVNVALAEHAALASWYRRATFIGVGTSFALICAIFLLHLLHRQFARLIDSETALKNREKTLAERTGELTQLAHFDQLTGLANRISLHNDLRSAFLSLDDAAAAVAVAMFDLDGFKDINDTLGHSIGDKLLQEVAKRMIDVAPQNGTFYRLGGDEFVLVLHNCGDPLELSKIVETVLRRLAAKIDIGEHQLFVGASAGIAISPVHGTDIEELLSNADLALYDAKAAGGNTSKLFVPVLRARAQTRRTLELELRRACFNSEFELFYQPQIRAIDGAVTGVEALLRWRHPERGLLTPGTFIDALSNSSVASEVGRWILQTACVQAAEWREGGLPPLRIGVNLFSAQFQGQLLLADVENALSKSALPADALELEITENIALSEQAKSIEILRALRAKGVKLAFDDFGTGYASLSYLTRYPLTRIKIDQSFVRKITAGSPAEETAIVRSIIVMAHNLGLQVTAEGVETEAQAAFLAAEGCEELQGYLYAKPLPADDIKFFLWANAGRNIGKEVKTLPAKQSGF